MSVPFSILTGYLGAGKTTVLNRVLANAQGRRIAVLVNELGRVAIDSKLILSRGSDVLELAGGCICCSLDLKNDLWDGIVDVVKRSKPDHVVLETTGIAEPQAIVDGLGRLPAEHQGVVDLAGVIAVVDGVVGKATLQDREEASEQVITADRVLFSKLDIAGPELVSAIHSSVSALNNDAERAAFPHTPDGDRALVPWLLNHRRQAKKAARSHHHSHQVSAAVFCEQTPLHSVPLMKLFEELAPTLLRVKGWVHIANEQRRAYLELAGDTLSLRYDKPWGETRPETELVVIGDNLDEAALRRRLWACRTST